MNDKDQGLAWPPAEPERVPSVGDSAGAARMALRRRNANPPLDEWITRAKSGSDDRGVMDSIVITTARLSVDASKELVAKAAECVRGIELLDRVMASSTDMQRMCSSSGLDEGSVQKMLLMKREELVKRRTAMMGAIDAPVGFTLLIEHGADKFSVG